MGTLSTTAAPPLVASRGKILMMAVIAGAVITNLYRIQPILPLIAADMGIGLSTVDLVANQTRAFTVDPAAQGRINSVYMTATFCGGAIGVALSGWLMARFGWTGIAWLGIALALAGGIIHAGAKKDKA